jgi:hypothetical protein
LLGNLWPDTGRILLRRGNELHDVLLDDASGTLIE